MTDQRISERSLRAWERHLGCDAGDAQRLRTALTAGTLPTAFAETAAAAPGRPAVTIDGQTLTHGELDALSARLGYALAGMGAGPGHHVLLSAAVSTAFVVAYLAVLRTGATVVLAGAHLTEAELDHLVTDSGAAIAVAEAPALEHLGGIVARRGRPTAVVALTGPEPPGAVPAAALFDGPALDPVAVDGGAAALLAYTSGTTGRPKGVPLSHASLLASIRGVMLAWRWSSDDVLVHALPLTHQHGLGGVHASLLSGSRAVVLPRFDAQVLLDTLAAEDATVLFAVPAIYERLLALGSQVALPALRLAVSGSAPLPPVLAGRIEGLLGQLPLERYGTTESGLDVSNPYEGPRTPGTVGLPLPGVELEILAPGGDLVAPGTDGEIVLRGPQVFSGYHGLPEATAEAFRAGGWFQTGDIGRIDPDSGYLSITGRLKELIISGGLNVYPREVEQVLEEHPAVASVAVVGVPSERWGEEVAAAVVPAPGHERLPVEALSAHVAQRLSAYKRPKRYFPVETLPLNPMGKVLRGALASLLAQRAAEAET